MLLPTNGYVFIERMDDEKLEKKEGLIYDTNLNRDKLVKGRVFVDNPEGEGYYSYYQPGAEVLCDIVGAREFTYKDRELYIVGEDAIFGFFKMVERAQVVFPETDGTMEVNLGGN